MSMWVFGYGSLLWNPGFEIDEKQIGLMHGYARSFCMRSIHHRGTAEHPGLVLALDEMDGASCEGVALRVKAGDEEQTLAYLREQQVELEQTNSQLEEQAQAIATAVGDRGPNTEYLHNTAAHLVELGIEDADLNWLSRRVVALCS